MGECALTPTIVYADICVCARVCVWVCVLRVKDSQGKLFYNCHVSRHFKHITNLCCVLNRADECCCCCCCSSSLHSSSSSSLEFSQALTWSWPDSPPALICLTLPKPLWVRPAGLQIKQLTVTAAPELQIHSPTLHRRHTPPNVSLLLWRPNGANFPNFWCLRPLSPHVLIVRGYLICS